MDNSSHHPYCTQLVKQYDYDRYFCSLFTSRDKQQHLHALYAFSHELAKIKEITKEEMIGLIRLQWWKETLDSIAHGSPRNHEVALALNDLYQTRPDLITPLYDVISAREQDLDLSPFTTLADFEAYAQKTSSTLLRVGLDILEIDDSAVQNAVDHIGIAWALVGHIRSLYHHWEHQFCCFPKDALTAHNMTAESLLEAPDIAVLKSLIQHIIDRAEYHLQESTLLLKSPAPYKDASPLILLGTITQHTIRYIKKHNYHPHAAQRALPRFGVQLRCLIAYWKL